jgi:hypothetical protein
MMLSLVRVLCAQTEDSIGKACPGPTPEGGPDGMPGVVRVPVKIESLRFQVGLVALLQALLLVVPGARDLAGAGRRDRRGRRRARALEAHP